jgi:hypothetical protein
MFLTHIEPQAKCRFNTTQSRFNTTLLKAARFPVDEKMGVIYHSVHVEQSLTKKATRLYSICETLPFLPAGILWALSSLICITYVVLKPRTDH